MMAHLRVAMGLFSAATAAAGGALPAPEQDLAPVGGLHAVLEDGQLWDVAIGRRPYITETTGELLLQASPAILGKTLTITAELPCAKKSWRWTQATALDTEQYILNFTLSGLPDNLNNDMIINVTVPGMAESRGTPRNQDNIPPSMRRRFQRAHKADLNNTVQVDHSTRGLRVNGEPWAGFGWYIYPWTSFEGPREGPCPGNRSAPLWPNQTADCIRWGIGNMTRDMAQMGDRGITMIMPYNFNPYEHDGIGDVPIDELRALILNYFDVAHAHGVKILHHLASMELDRGHYTNATLAQLKETVALVKDHPALLAYYFCDDCGPHPDMTVAYNTVRHMDPYHLTVGAGFAGNKPQYTDNTFNPPCPAEYCGHAMDEAPMLPSFDCSTAQGADKPKPCAARYKNACDVSAVNHTGGGCCVSCGTLNSLIPKTALSLDIVMIENYSPSPDAHAKSDHGILRSGVPWTPMVNCDGSYTLEESIKPHMAPNVLQTLRKHPK